MLSTPRACFAILLNLLAVPAIRADRPDVNTTPQDASTQLLMPDNFESLQGVAWRVEPALPDPNNPLLEGEMPWDRGGVMTHGTVLKDPIDGAFKAWIICTPPEDELKDHVQRQVFTINHHLRRLCYFESKDGIHWARSTLPDSRFGDYEATNIIFDDSSHGKFSFTQYASVSVDPDNKAWPYEMFVYRDMTAKVPPGHSHLHQYRSRDGKTWQHVHGPIKGPFASDVCFVYPAKFLATDQRDGYVAYYRVSEPDNEAHIPAYEYQGRTRQLFRAGSPDGKSWTAGEKIIKRDERDHRDTQYMELVPHPVPGGYLGIVSVFRPLTQTQNLRLAVSRDGRLWWFPDRRPCLDNPPLGDYGGGMIWQSKSLVADQGRLHVYYGGMEGLHRPIMDSRISPERTRTIGIETVVDHPHGFLPFNSALCRASWPVGRLYALASATGGPTVGNAVTTPLAFGGRKLTVNLRTLSPKKSATPGLDEGYLQVELLDARDKPLAGFTRADCPLLRGDDIAMPVQWTGGQIAPPEAAKARFYLKRAFLYGFTPSLPAF